MHISNLGKIKRRVEDKLSPMSSVHLQVYFSFSSSEPANSTEQVVVVETKKEMKTETVTSNEAAEVVAESKKSESAATTTQETQEQNNRLAATLVEVTDGDTLKVKVDGKEEKVRLLLIDTPETDHPKEGGTTVW